MKIYEKRAVCPYDCPDTCGMICQTDGKEILGVKGDPDHPVTRGILCRKMQQYEKDINSKDRILHPMKRVGPKGIEDSFVPISWEEAIHSIGENWRELIATYGAQSILPYSYAGNMGIISENCGEAFFYALGATTLDRTICSDAKGAGNKMTMGSFHDWHSSHIQDADLIILWSSNPKSNRLHVVPDIMDAKKRGAKVILIDVYEHISADLADEVILVKPGSDAAFMLAVMKLLEEGNFLDHTFIDTYTTGFEALKEEYDSWTPEKAELICGVPAETIRSFAKTYGEAKKAMMVCGSGMSRYTNGGAAYRLLLCLPALIGAWKRGGGTSSTMGGSRFLDKTPITHPEWEQDVRMVNMNQLGHVLTKLEPKIRSLYVYCSNPAVMTPDQNKVIEGLSRDDIFTVVHDRFLTDTALYADIVLPATFNIEHSDIYAAYGHYHAQVGYQVVPPKGESRCNWDTFCALAKEMGMEDPYFEQSVEELIEGLLNDDQFITISINNHLKEALIAGEPILFPQQDVLDIHTEDGKIHLTPKSPAYEPPKDQKHPLRLVMAHSPWAINSNFSYRRELMEARGDLTVRINTEDARERGIADGDICRAYNEFGNVKVRAQVTDAVKQGTVIAEGVYQKRWTFGEGNFSALLTEELTDYGRASSLNTNTVEIVKE